MKKQETQKKGIELFERKQDLFFPLILRRIQLMEGNIDEAKIVVWMNYWDDGLPYFSFAISCENRAHEQTPYYPVSSLENPIDDIDFKRSPIKIRSFDGSVLNKF
jgi:hypothetical protein